MGARKGRKGSREKALRVLAEIADRLEAGRQLPLHLCDYLSKSIREIESGEKTADQALGLVGRRGRSPDDGKVFRDTLIVAQVRQYLDSERATLADAREWVAEEFGIDETTVRRALRDFLP